MRSKEKVSNIDSSQGKQKHVDLKLRKKLQNKLSKLEAEISSIENEIINDDHKISENFHDLKPDDNFFKEYQAKKDKVEVLMSEWEQVQQEVELLN